MCRNIWQKLECRDNRVLDKLLILDFMHTNKGSYVYQENYRVTKIFL